VAMMCRLLKVSRSGFYTRRRWPVSQQEQRRALVDDAVEAAFTDFKKHYGAPRLMVLN